MSTRPLEIAAMATSPAPSLPKKLLVVSALFPPNAIGGAEQSAHNLSKWLASRGIEVHYLANARAPDDVVMGVKEGDLFAWRVHMPRPYQIFNFPRAPRWKKPIWHLQDHLDPRNVSIFSDILDKVQPDFVNIHYIQGFGYNILKELADRDLPALMILHDMGLACVRMSMFKNGKNCKTQCLGCKVSGKYKQELINKVPRIGISSPSAANLRLVEQFVDIDTPHKRVILNPNKYPLPNRPKAHRKSTRFLYVGRIHSSKGIDTALAAAEQLAIDHELEFVVVGGGPDEDMLKARFAKHSWCRFTGHVTQQDVANEMADSDILCTPSIWAENSPGVVIHALSLGVPVIGSNVGGIPELVQNEHNGLLVEPGSMPHWSSAMKRILENPALLTDLKENATSSSARFGQDELGEQYLSLIQTLFGRA